MTEAEARKLLANYIQLDNSLGNVGAYISWDKTRAGLVIDNDPYSFALTPEVLEALAWWIREYADD